MSAKLPDPKPLKRHKATTAEWQAIRNRLLPATCVVCHTTPASSLHHVVRRSKSGDDVVENLIPVCGTGTTGCHGLIEARSQWALGRVREAVRDRPEVLDYVVARKGWGWFDRAYPEWQVAA